MRKSSMINTQIIDHRSSTGHRLPAAQRHPASHDAVDEPEGHHPEREPDNHQTDPERENHEQHTGRHPRSPNQNVRICQRKCDSSQLPCASLRFT